MPDVQLIRFAELEKFGVIADVNNAERFVSDSGFQSQFALNAF